MNTCTRRTEFAKQSTVALALWVRKVKLGFTRVYINFLIGRHNFQPIMSKKNSKMSSTKIYIL